MVYSLTLSLKNLRRLGKKHHMTVLGKYNKKKTTRKMKTPKSNALLITSAFSSHHTKSCVKIFSRFSTNKPLQTVDLAVWTFWHPQELYQTLTASCRRRLCCHSRQHILDTNLQTNEIKIYASMKTKSYSYTVCQTSIIEMNMITVQTIVIPPLFQINRIWFENSFVNYDATF